MIYTFIIANSVENLLQISHDFVVVLYNPYTQYLQALLSSKDVESDILQNFKAFSRVGLGILVKSTQTKRFLI